MGFRVYGHGLRIGSWEQDVWRYNLIISMMVSTAIMN